MNIRFDEDIWKLARRVLRAYAEHDGQPVGLTGEDYETAQTMIEDGLLYLNDIDEEDEDHITVLPGTICPPVPGRATDLDDEVVIESTYHATRRAIMAAQKSKKKATATKKATAKKKTTRGRAAKAIEEGTAKGRATVTKKAAPKKVAPKRGERKTIRAAIFAMLQKDASNEAICKMVAKEFPASKFNEYPCPSMMSFYRYHFAKAFPTSKEAKRRAAAAKKA
jgi:hypothetical protein